MTKALKLCYCVLLLNTFFISKATNKVDNQEIKMDFSVSFEDAQSHYVEVVLNFENLHSKTTNLILPVWTPGYYLILNTPRYIVDFEVTDGKNQKIKWKKSTKNSWTIENGTASKITVKYHVFANKKSVAESYVDAEKAFIMPNTIFMHVENKIDNPVTVTLNKPSKWSKISTGLKCIDEAKNSFYAKNIDVFYDSPIYIGNQKTIEFENEGKKYSLGVATPQGLEEEKFVADLKKIMSATTSIMKKIPYENYSYIMMEAGGGGLEHWNSQAIFTKGSFDSKSRRDYLDFMNFVTHEYFHLYNVKAIRPIELGPFDYNKENYTTMLWFSEGFTVYYEYLIMVKAGLMEGKDALQYLSGSIKKYENEEGCRHMSLAQSSFDIWSNFFNNESNAKQTTISYYDKGPTIGLLLDLEIRNNTANKKSLDDLMRFLYNEYFEKKQRGFTEEEFWSAATEISGKSLDEIKTYVNTTQEIDYQKYLQYGGLQIDMTPLKTEAKSDKFTEKNYTISELPKASKLQLEIRKSIFNF